MQPKTLRELDKWNYIIVIRILYYLNTTRRSTINIVTSTPFSQSVKD